jgi:hypothetical protein
MEYHYPVHKMLCLHKGESQYLVFRRPSRAREGKGALCAQFKKEKMR